jgi:hypothetical protein
MTGRRSWLVGLLLVTACSSTVQGNGSSRPATGSAAPSGAGTSARGGSFGEAGPPSTSSAPPSTTTVTATAPAPDPLRVVDVQLLGSAGGDVEMTLWATDDLTDCAAHSHGQLVGYFQAHPCRGATRYLWTFQHDGRELVLSVVSIIAAPGPSDDIYKWAGKFIQLENADNTGSINTLIEDGHAIPGIATTIPSDEVFDVTGQDNGVTVFDAWYLHGATNPNDPQLKAFLEQDVFLSQATTVNNQH